MLTDQIYIALESCLKKILPYEGKSIVKIRRCYGIKIYKNIIIIKAGYSAMAK